MLQRLTSFQVYILQVYKFTFYKFTSLHFTSLQVYILQVYNLQVYILQVYKFTFKLSGFHEQKLTYVVLISFLSVKNFLSCDVGASDDVTQPRDVLLCDAIVTPNVFHHF